MFVFGGSNVKEEAWTGMSMKVWIEEKVTVRNAWNTISAKAFSWKLVENCLLSLRKNDYGATKKASGFSVNKCRLSYGVKCGGSASSKPGICRWRAETREKLWYVWKKAQWVSEEARRWKKIYSMKVCRICNGSIWILLKKTMCLMKGETRRRRWKTKMWAIISVSESLSGVLMLHLENYIRCSEAMVAKAINEETIYSLRKLFHQLKIFCMWRQTLM